MTKRRRCCLFLIGFLWALLPPMAFARDLVLGRDCFPCDVPGLPDVGSRALKLSHNDPYAAVDILLPSADDVSSQISIAFIMQDALRSNWKGRTKERFSWRESWGWWRLAALGDEHVAALLGGRYAKGDIGLAKNAELANCLEIGNSAPVRDRVSGCFRRYNR